MGKRKRRVLPVMRAAELAKRLSRHPQCEVKYRNRKYLLIRRWDDHVRTNCLQENSVFNNNAIRAILRQLGLSDDELEALFD